MLADLMQVRSAAEDDHASARYAPCEIVGPLDPDRVALAPQRRGLGFGMLGADSAAGDHHVELARADFGELVRRRAATKHVDQVSGAVLGGEVEVLRAGASQPLPPFFCRVSIVAHGVCLSDVSPGGRGSPPATAPLQAAAPEVTDE
jgi:hypothetical protein